MESGFDDVGIREGRKAASSVCPLKGSENDQVEFDNEEECNAYNEEWHCHEWQREQEQEDEWWEEEYYCRRHDLYWKNDSDYD